MYIGSFRDGARDVGRGRCGLENQKQKHKQKHKQQEPRKHEANPQKCFAIGNARTATTTTMPGRTNAINAGDDVHCCHLARRKLLIGSQIRGTSGLEIS